MAEKVLIVDDDPVQRRLIENLLQRFGYEAIAVEGGEAALAVIFGIDPPRIDAIILDLMMPGIDGLAVLERLREAASAIPVIVQTAHGGIDNVVSAMRAGAVDFVVKPFGPERLQVSLRNALATRALESELARLKHSRAGTLTFKDIITRSPKLMAVLRTAEKAATSAIPVLLEGESGVGKELIARAIHGSSDRRSKPFVAVNCGAIPDNLVESTLFGHERGAFTGATERHVGKFVEASGGTLLLDEVSELPLAAQVKLLRAIQGDEIDTVGGRKPVKVDVRLISACNRNLLAAVREGRFREDLFYRLNVLPIAVPALRERPEDIPDLVRHFVARFTAEEGKRIRAVTAPAMALLGAYSWPGNVRQLENAIFRAVVLAENDEIGVDEFPQIASQVAAPPTAAPPTAPDSFVPAVGDVETLEADAPAQALDLAPDLVAPSPVPVPVLDPAGEIRPLDAIEADLIRFAIEHYGGQMSQVARRLRIGRSTLYRRLKDLGLESDAGPSVATERHSRGIV